MLHLLRPDSTSGSLQDDEEIDSEAESDDGVLPYTSAVKVALSLVCTHPQQYQRQRNV